MTRHAAHPTDSNTYAKPCTTCGGPITLDQLVNVIDVIEGTTPGEGRWIRALIEHRRCPSRRLVLTARGRHVRDIALAAAASCTVVGLANLLQHLVTRT